MDAPITSSSVTITSSSSAKINVRHIKANNLKIEVNSSSKFDGHVDASNVDINASSSGKIALTGELKDLNVQMSSSAKLDVTKADVGNLTCNGSSSAKLDITTTSTLKSDLSSSASITYSKEPAKIMLNKSSSSGKLVKRSL